jgi:hypothetical protein
VASESTLRIFYALKDFFFTIFSTTPLKRVCPVVCVEMSDSIFFVNVTSTLRNLVDKDIEFRPLPILLYPLLRTNHVKYRDLVNKYKQIFGSLVCM